MRKGKGPVIAINGPPKPDPMAELHRTIGAPPENGADLPTRQVIAQKVGGLHHSLYNWLVLGGEPSIPITTSAVAPHAAIESVTDSSSANPCDQKP